MEKVIVLNRFQSIELTENDFSLNRVIISIYSVGDDPPVFNSNNYSIKDILYLNFNDWDDGRPDCIQGWQAKEIVNFANKYWDSVDQIVVHCDGGVSRSAGCAAALLRHFTGDDSKIFDNPNYYPNMLVYRQVLRAFRYKEEQERIDDLIKDLELLKSSVEWDYPLVLQEIINNAIEYIKETKYK